MWAVWVRVSFAPDRQLFTGTRRVVAHGPHASRTRDPRSHPLTPDSAVLFYPVQSRTVGTVRTPAYEQHTVSRMGTLGAATRVASAARA